MPLRRATYSKKHIAYTIKLDVRKLDPIICTQTWYYEDVSACKNEGPVWNDLNVKAQAKYFSALLYIWHTGWTGYKMVL